VCTYADAPHHMQLVQENIEGVLRTSLSD
jgi:hypothetical protein